MSASPVGEAIRHSLQADLSMTVFTKRRDQKRSFQSRTALGSAPRAMPRKSDRSGAGMTITPSPFGNEDKLLPRTPLLRFPHRFGNADLKLR
jgi:hypothetical protein